MKALIYKVQPVKWAACLLARRFRPQCVYGPLGGLSLHDVPPPKLPGDDWALCRTVLGGICGTDLSIIHQRQPIDSILQCFTTLPMTLGHENVAVVEQCGPAMDKAWLGKTVTVEPTLCCRARGIEPPCPSCARGQYGACENFSANGLGRYHLPPGTSIGYCGAVGGTWSEFFPAHVSQLIEKPAAIPNTVAILTDPLACSLHAVLRANLSGVQRVLIYGCGILGLGAVWSLRRVGYTGKIGVIARHAHQAKLANQLGASEIISLPRGAVERHERIARQTGGRLVTGRFHTCMISGGYDVVFDCVGSAGSVQDSLKWTAARGQVVLLASGHARGADLTPLWFSELTVIGSYGRSVENFGGAVHTYNLTHRFMQQDLACLQGLLTHTFGLGQYRQAMLAASDKGGQGSIKVAFSFE